MKNQTKIPSELLSFSLSTTARKLLIALILASGSLAGPQAFAVAITTLFNTGVDTSGAVLPSGTVGDPHYELVSVPGGTTMTRVVDSSNGFPIPPWVADNSVSRWIGPNNTPDVQGPAGDYIYRTTFSLAGFQAATAAISGNFAADDVMISIILNEIVTPIGGSFTEFTPFSLTSGFVPGLNTLDFKLLNGPYLTYLNWTGLRVEMKGTATASAPDGGTTFALLGISLGGLAALRRKFVRA